LHQNQSSASLFDTFSSREPAPTSLENALFRQLLAVSVYFGRTLGSPPGLPGGGITGVLPVSGVGAWISGSTPAGGHSTPSDLASLSPSGSAARWPVVVPSGETVPRGGIGAQSLARAAAGGAVWAGGVAGEGGDCALATPHAAVSTHERKSVCFICMQGKRPARAGVP
jgi:hypothetical protein